MRHSFASVLILASLPLPAAALTLSDGTFLESNWNATEILDTSGAASFSASQQIAGGNPDAFRQTQLSVPAGQSIILDHVFSSGQYDPVAEGGIESIDFALDLRFVGGSVGTSQVGYQLLLVQGSAHYTALATTAIALGPGGGAPGAWVTSSFAGLISASFTRISSAGPDTPDFSAGGGVLQFGYLTQNSSIDTAISTTSGIDNWSVVIHPAPEPSAGGLFGMALLGSFLALRRARPCAATGSVEDSRDAGSLPPL